MIKSILSTLACAAVLSSAAFAGAPVVAVDKNPVPLAPVEYGLGWYGALDGGINAYQDLGGGRTINQTGHAVTLAPRQSVGGFGGLKVGYVFGNGFVRPAFEAEGFYNGVDASTDVNLDGHNKGNINSRLDSGAFLGNALLRFNFERFQPYVGFGLGYWVAQANDVSVNVGGHSFAHSSSNTTGDLAWQIVAGADYYFTPKISTFVEYKFLNYENAFFGKTAQQQLVGVGVRFHF